MDENNFFPENIAPEEGQEPVAAPPTEEAEAEAAPTPDTDATSAAGNATPDATQNTTPDTTPIQATYAQYTNPQPGMQSSYFHYTQPNYTQPNGYNYNSYQNGYNYNPSPYPPTPAPKPEKKKNPNAWKVWVALLCIFCLCLSVVLGAAYSSRYLSGRISAGTFSFPETSSPSEDGTLTSVPNSAYESVADIVEDVGKSVVTIITALTTTEGYFTVDAEALGSGIIIGEQGDKLYIATNYHVIEDATAVSVIVGNDETKAISAYHQGSDEDSDLAVIYIKKSDIPDDILQEIKIATLGESSSLRLGDLAIAIGSPVDKSFGNTTTVGTISGLERSVTFTDDDNISTTMVLLQTDAAINPGNSGGALVNGRGEVIGINNAKLVDTDVEGMGFAIPIDTAKPILETLINEGKITRPYLGIAGYNVADSSALQQYQLLTGVYVQQVTSGGAADKAGIQVNDIIVSFNGVTVNNFDDLKAELNQCTIGQIVKVEVIRGYLQGEPYTTELELTVQDKNS